MYIYTYIHPEVLVVLKKEENDFFDSSCYSSIMKLNIKTEINSQFDRSLQHFSKILEVERTSGQLDSGNNKGDNMKVKSWKNPDSEGVWLQSCLMPKEVDRFHVRNGF